MQATFDFDAVNERRDNGIQMSSEASGEEWSEYAIEFVRNYLIRNSTLHVDALWQAGLSVPVSQRALGGVMQHVIRSGWVTKIVTTEGYTAAMPSMSSNQQLKPVWRSMLFS